jgi:hypothetical protein
MFVEKILQLIANHLETASRQSLPDFCCHTHSLNVSFCSVATQTPFSLDLHHIGEHHRGSEE